MSKPLFPRNEIPLEYTWDAASVFSSDDAWEAAIREVTEFLAALESFQSHLGDSPAVLADYFDAVEQMFNQVGKIYVYASMLNTVDTGDQEAAAKADRSRSLHAQAAAVVAFAEPEILALGAETLERWTQQEPRLAAFTHYFAELERRRARVRSAEVEEILGLVDDPFRTASLTHRTLTDADMVFDPAQPADQDANPVVVAQGTIAALMTHPDREVRRTAWENYADAHLAYKNTMANNVTAAVKQHVFMARARRYDSSLEAAVGRNNIPIEVFHNLIKTYRRNLPIWHRYWRIRRRAMGVDALREYDVKAPLANNLPKIPFEQAVEWICQGMEPLGEDYVNTMRRGLLEQRWVDIYPNQGKRSGAFSSGVQGTHPFILMSYNDDIFSLSTLAHELGHSMHSYHTWQTQPFIYARYSLFVAEVASNFNQALVRARLLKSNPDPDFQIAVIEEAMSNFHRYFFIMPTLARLEDEIHRRVEAGGALSADTLIGLTADLFSEGYGDEVKVDRERTGITWAEFPIHMYADFYVYQYATGISGAHALAQKVLSGEAGAVDNYLAFLKAGSSLYPLDALKLAGVDLTTPDPVEQTFKVMADLVDRLEQLL
ncbi:MAG TPA: oligoendopeptidase F [Chloroflexi bacterium]|nr:oligoendopeptidase F [Chloroflexota bacterium]